MLKHQSKLLNDLAEGVKALAKQGDPKVNTIRVCLFQGKKEVRKYLGLAEALDEIVNGVYWDDSGSWSEANRVEVDLY